MLTTKVDNISTKIPIRSTTIVFVPVPFHSFRNIPHILLNAIFNAIRMLHANTDILKGNWLLPIPKNWNCMNHRNPARKVNKRLLKKIPLPPDI